MDTERFLKTNFGKEVKNNLAAWDKMLQVPDGKRTPEMMGALIWHQAQWEVRKMAIQDLFNIEYFFTRTDEYYGACTEDESDWLFKEYREPKERPRHEATKEDISAAMKAVMEIEREHEHSISTFETSQTVVDLVLEQTSKKKRKYGTPNFQKQKVTRRGIRVDGVEYWDDEFIRYNLGRNVILEVNESFIKVCAESGAPLHIFER